MIGFLGEIALNGRTGELRLPCSQLWVSFLWSTVYWKKDKSRVAYIPTMLSRASENFWGCLAQYPPKNLGQIPAALAISGIFEWFSPGQNGSEVWRQITLNSLTGPPTSGPFGPGENRSKMPEIARAAGIWPKFFGGYWARHPQKFSLALVNSLFSNFRKI